VRRVDEYNVLLTEEEQHCQERFEYLRLRHSDAFASMLALNEMRLIPGQFPTDEFIEYLSEGRCSKWGRRIRITPRWRTEMGK
jgi:hypothetical protein